MALQKARVQLLDPETGKVVAEVDVLTSAPVVSYINDNVVVRDFRGIPAGTTFAESEEKSVQDVLDDILYPYTASDILYITDDQGNQITEDTIIYKERFTEVRPFYINANIIAGNKTDLTITLKRYDVSTGTTTTTETTAKVTPGSTYRYQQNVEKFSFDTRFQIVVSDGQSTVASPIISYKFIYPVFVGYCNLEEILSTDGAIIDDANASQYFNTLIRNNSPMIEKRLVPIQNITGIAINNPLYTNSMYNPCIIYPNTWNKLISITDVNDDDITGSFMYNANVPIKPDSSVTSNVQYTVYANRNKYLVGLSAVAEISYNFQFRRGSADHIEEGVPSLTGFDVLCKLPVDLRTVVQSYGDLALIKYPYESLIVFVKDDKCFYRYMGDEANPKWEPTNQQVFVQTTGEEPSLDQGQWGDIVIDIKSGIFYRKYKNIRWEELGRFVGGGTYVETWDPENPNHSTGDIVYHDGKYWEAVKDTATEPGTDDSWEETTVGGGVPGPVGPPGDAATIVIVDTVTGPPGSEASVTNIGDKQNARLVFTIPQGPRGDAANLDKTLTQENMGAEAKAVGDALNKKMNLPVNENGELQMGEEGEILYSNGDGTFSWVNLEEAINTWVEKAIERGVDMRSLMATTGIYSSLDIDSRKGK